MDCDRATFRRPHGPAFVKPRRTQGKDGQTIGVAGRDESLLSCFPPCTPRVRNLPDLHRTSLLVAEGLACRGHIVLSYTRKSEHLVLSRMSSNTRYATERIRSRCLVRYFCQTGHRCQQYSHPCCRDHVCTRGESRNVHEIDLGLRSRGCYILQSNCNVSQHTKPNCSTIVDVS